MLAGPVSVPWVEPPGSDEESAGGFAKATFPSAGTRPRSLDILSSYRVTARSASICPNIKTLANFEPPATDDEMRARLRFG